MPPLETLFGKDTARYLGMLDALTVTTHSTRYTFTSNQLYKSIVYNDPAKANQILWREILARSHLTAAIAILRNRSWIKAMVSAINENNLLAFAAAMRGFLESAADSSTSLDIVPARLAHYHENIISALSGAFGDTIFPVDRLEDELIHFAFARKLTKNERETSPSSHSAKQISEYIEVLRKGQVPKADECYRAMCDLAHPGASSVWMWLRSVSELEFYLAPRQHESEISGLLSQYRETFQHIVMYAFHPSIVTLRVLNYFPLEEFHVPALMTWDMSGIPLWKKCLTKLNGAPSRVRAPLRAVKPNPSLQRTPHKRRARRA